jgi:hypothetical protein
MLTVCFHAGRRHRPDTGVYVDLFPARANSFAGASCRQQGELECESNRLGARRFPDLRKKSRNIALGNGAVVLNASRLLGKSSTNRLSCINSQAGSLTDGGGPIQHDPDALPNSTSRLRLDEPDW